MSSRVCRTGCSQVCLGIAKYVQVYPTIATVQLAKSRCWSSAPLCASALELQVDWLCTEMSWIMSGRKALCSMCGLCSISSDCDQAAYHAVHIIRPISWGAYGDQLCAPLSAIRKDHHRKWAASARQIPRKPLRKGLRAFSLCSAEPCGSKAAEQLKKPNEIQEVSKSNMYNALSFNRVHF